LALYEQMHQKMPNFKEEIESDKNELLTAFTYCDGYDDATLKILKGLVHKVSREDLQYFFRKSPTHLSLGRVTLV